MQGTMSENIVKVFPRDTEDSVAEYSFDITCTNCREANDSAVFINSFETHEMSGSRGEASFTMKCKFCGNESSVNLSHYEEALWNPENENYDNGTLKSLLDQRKKNGIKHADKNCALLLKLDCRGCELVKFNPGNIQFSVEMNSGSTIEAQFEDGEDEWYDYDDKDSTEVSITDLKFEIIKG